jgi:RNA polymerase sigma-70 factor (ECF subfamily)
MDSGFEIKYRKLFRTYYANLLFYAKRIVGDDDAEDVVQDVFVELWHRKKTKITDEQIQAFLYKAVYTRALNVLKHREVRENYKTMQQELHLKRVAFYQPDNNEVMKKIENKELRNEIVAAINELPDKCKLIFKLSYLQEMKNKTIAEMMGCSQRTVEAHVYKALKILRNKLDNLYVLLAIFSPYKISDFFRKNCFIDKQG